MSNAEKEVKEVRRNTRQKLAAGKTRIILDDLRGERSVTDLYSSLPGQYIDAMLATCAQV